MSEEADLAAAHALVRSQDVALMRACEEIDHLRDELNRIRQATADEIAAALDRELADAPGSFRAGLQRALRVVRDVRIARRVGGGGGGGQ